MSRLPQSADKYAKNHFLTHFEMQQTRYGLKSQESISNKVGISQSTVGNHKKDPDKIQVGIMKKYIKVLRLNPVYVLELLGVSKKEATEALKQIASGADEIVCSKPEENPR